jgi:hypothetical protein
MYYLDVSFCFESVTSVVFVVASAVSAGVAAAGVGGLLLLEPFLVFLSPGPLE